jgi:hypothetical protein
MDRCDKELQMRPKLNEKRIMHPCVESYVCPFCRAIRGVPCRPHGKISGPYVPPHMPRIIKHVNASAKKLTDKFEKEDKKWKRG